LDEYKLNRINAYVLYNVVWIGWIWIK